MGECRESETAQRYVAGRLSAVEAERFELHLLTCERCQAEVRLGAAIAAVQSPRVAQPDAHSTTPVHRPLSRLPLVALPIVAAAAAITFIVTVPDAEPDLGAVIAPVFSGAPLRSTGRPTPVDDGMAAYALADYRRAADLLGQVSASDSSPALGFYLGISRLLTGDEEGALRALALPRSAGGSPYQFDASLFAAKAHVRLGNVDSAIAILRTIPATAASATRARAFADSIVARRR